MANPSQGSRKADTPDTGTDTDTDGDADVFRTTIVTVIPYDVTSILTPTFYFQPTITEQPSGEGVLESTWASGTTTLVYTPTVAFGAKDIAAGPTSTQ